MGRENWAEPSTDGIQVDLIFEYDKPVLGDLLLLQGGPYPGFVPSGKFAFDTLRDYKFEQVDDYFGIRSETRDGTDIIIWLYPLIDGEEVYHFPGPFTGLRLDYNVLRNPTRHINLFLEVIRAFAVTLNSRTVYQARELDLGYPPDLSLVEQDILQIAQYWEKKGIVPGSKEALLTPR